MESSRDIYSRYIATSSTASQLFHSYSSAWAATVERTFSSMKLIKTRLRSRMGEDTPEHAMRICTEGPDHLSSDTLEAVVGCYKGSKKRKLALWALLGVSIMLPACLMSLLAINDINNTFCYWVNFVCSLTVSWRDSWVDFEGSVCFHTVIV